MSENESKPMRTDLAWLMVFIVVGFLSIPIITGCERICCAQQILPEAQRTAMVALLPEVRDSKLAEILQSPNTQWYTRQVMPPAYQIGQGSLGRVGPLCVSDVMQNISRDNGEGDKLDGAGGNANIDFPWGLSPGGTMRDGEMVNGKIQRDHQRDFKAMYLPSREDGKPWPVVVSTATFKDAFRARDNQGTDDIGLTWGFPVGTVFIEVLAQRYNGVDIVFEIRTRTREDHAWDAQIYRPFSTPATLATAIKGARPEFQSAPKLARLVSDLESPKQLTRLHLVDKHIGGRRSFDEWASIDELPAVDDDQLMLALLAETPFSAVNGEEWRDDCAAPTTKATSLHIVPKDYDAAFLGVDRSTCNNCHKDAGDPARDFDPLRGWYGYVRGSITEGIISWHPFDPAVFVGIQRDRSVPLLTAENRINTAALRPAFLESGIVEIYDPSKHPRAMYHAIRKE